MSLSNLFKKKGQFPFLGDMSIDNLYSVPPPEGDAQHKESEPKRELALSERDGKTYIRLYLFMRAECLKRVLENDALKVVLPEECNDPMEFTVAHSDDPMVKLSEPIGMLCFSADYKNSAMWGHYADSHKGVCIEFEFKAKKNKGELCYFLDLDGHSHVISLPIEKNHDYPCEKFFDAILWPVNYTNIRPKLSRLAHFFEAGINHPYQKDMDEIFKGPQGIDLQRLISNIRVTDIVLAKPEHWRYEDEYRLFVYLDHDCIFKDGNYFVAGLPKYIRRIILGVNCNLDDSFVQKLESMWRDKQGNSPFPEILRARYHAEKYEIEID